MSAATQEHTEPTGGDAGGGSGGSGGGQHRLGPLAEIPEGEGRAYTVGDEQVAVYRLRDGRVLATQALCPHLGGPLADGLLDGKVVVCPLHSNAYELETGCSTTGQDPLTTFTVQVDDEGTLLVTVPA